MRLRIALRTRSRLSPAFLLAAILLASVPVRAQSLSPPPLPLRPEGVAYDGAGNLYFTDSARNVVYESSLAGALTIVAGSGVQGFAGDGGPAASAQLNAPQGIALGGDGTLYIADTGNQRIRAVSGGQITTFAGSGQPGFSGDGGPATAASFRHPTALAVDPSGALLVCDTGNQRVRRIAAGGVTTVAGNGVQGFSGDGALATSASLDTPAGVAVDSNGRMYIADSHNQRIRVVAADGTIATFAGSGVPGFSGDGGPATLAKLLLPQGLLMAPGGTLLIADAENHRLRSVDPQGIIGSIAGSGVQGASRDGDGALTAGLDNPHSVALSSFGATVFADGRNHAVQESLPSGGLYLPAGMAPQRLSGVALAAPTGQSYGNETDNASVTGVAGMPQGTVQLADGADALASAGLSAGTVSFPVGAVPAGTHSVVASYLGDGVNPAAVSPAQEVMVAAAEAVATANAETISYGDPVPALTGTISGILSGDADAVSVVFSSDAASLSAPGVYPIAAALSGAASGNYTVVMSPTSGSLQIDQAGSVTSIQPLPPGSYEGFPILLLATVGSSTRGTPSGTVSFNDGATLIATAQLMNGSAAATYLSPSSGPHSIVATYAGDTDFKPSTSAPANTSVGMLPDFTLVATGSSTFTVSAGGMATYQLSVTAQPAPFTGAISFSVAGLPSGATASFSPTQTIPGAGSAAVAMSVQTAAAQAVSHRSGSWLLAAFLVLPLCVRRRKRLAAVVLLALVGTIATGCGARTVTTASLAHQVYSLQVTATATNLAGALVTHSTAVTLIMD